MTERLYESDPYLKEFTAKVLRRAARGVVLDRSAFFPAGGGQPCDLGTLNGHDVSDVVEEGGEIYHVVAGDVEGEVRGVIDWERRRDHMQQHHGQHLLSEAFIRVAGAATTAFHLGREDCSIDLDKRVEALDIERAETLANMVVVENRPVVAQLHPPDEARRLLRKPPPEGVGNVRVVRAGDFDSQACCGTHPRSTAEVGVIQVTGEEKGKTGSRLYFVCGFRALREARENARILRKLGQMLSTSRAGLEASCERALADAAEARRALEAAEKELAVHAGRELAARGAVAVQAYDGRSAAFLRAAATEAVRVAESIALVGATGENGLLVFARGAKAEVDLRPLFQEAVALLQGKGGGSPKFVQGGGPGKDVEAALRLAEGKVRAALGL